MSYTTIEDLTDLVVLEKRRTTLAKKRDFAALARTYRVTQEKENGNTGHFWDHRFDVETEELKINYVELDRNQTAYRWMLELLSPGKRILNIGCGNGKFESFFELSKFGGVAYEGTDFAKNSIRQLKKKYPQFHFWVGNINETQFLHKFDILCVFEVLEHISADMVLPLLRKLYSHTEKGGYLMVAVPTNEPLLEMFPSNPNEHVRLYSKELICAELGLAGYTIIKSEEFIAFSSFYMIKKFLSKTLLRGKWKPNDLLILAQKK